MPPGSQNGGYNDTIKELASYSHLGITFAIVIIVFVLGGRYLDKKLGVEPFLTLVGAFIGGGTGFYYVVRGLIRRRDDTLKDEKDNNNDINK